jgi:hypothetical protein
MTGKLKTQLAAAFDWPVDVAAVVSFGTVTLQGGRILLRQMTALRP